MTTVELEKVQSKFTVVSRMINLMPEIFRMVEASQLALRRRLRRVKEVKKKMERALDLRVQIQRFQLKRALTQGLTPDCAVFLETMTRGDEAEEELANLKQSGVKTVDDINRLRAKYMGLLADTPVSIVGFSFSQGSSS